MLDSIAPVSRPLRPEIDLPLPPLWPPTFPESRHPAIHPPNHMAHSLTCTKAPHLPRTRQLTPLLTPASQRPSSPTPLHHPPTAHPCYASPTNHPEHPQNPGSIDTPYPLYNLSATPFLLGLHALRPGPLAWFRPAPATRHLPQPRHHGDNHERNPLDADLRRGGGNAHRRPRTVAGRRHRGRQPVRVQPQGTHRPLHHPGACLSPPPRPSHELTHPRPA